MTLPPLTEEFPPLAVLLPPPLTEEKVPLAVLLTPPLTEEMKPLAVLRSPPLIAGPRPGGPVITSSADYGELAAGGVLLPPAHRRVPWRDQGYCHWRCSSLPTVDCGARKDR